MVWEGVNSSLSRPTSMWKATSQYRPSMATPSTVSPLSTPAMTQPG